MFGACYNDLFSTAELHFDSSFQGYPTCPYLSRVVRWPDSHKWPNMAKIAISAVLCVESGKFYTGQNFLLNKNEVWPEVAEEEFMLSWQMNPLCV